MFDSNLVKDLIKRKLWFDICLYLQDKSSLYPKECLTFIYEYVFPVHQKIHPHSFSKTVLTIANVLDPKESLSLVTSAMKLLETNEYKNEEDINGILRLEIKQNECRIHLNLLTNLERFIYATKVKKLDDEMKIYFYRTAYKYYETVQNYDDMISYLNKYISKYKENEIKDLYVEEKDVLAFKLVKYSLLSKKIFNFTEVFHCVIFKNLKDEGLKTIFEKVSEGNVTFLEENKEKIEIYFPNKFEELKEKVYLIAVVNMCFNKSDRSFRIKEFMDKLNVDRCVAFYLLVKAMGLGIIKGKIDGKDETVVLDYITPRVLTNEEIESMKNKILTWESKINETINMLK